MKPVLFEADATEFNTNGLGRLTDAASCTVTEERNGQYELHMEYPASGVHAADILNSRIIYAMPADNKDPQPFRIYRVSKPMQGLFEVDAEHISYQMTHIPVMPHKSNDIWTACTNLKAYAAETCPFTFSIGGNWQTTVANTFTVSQPDNLRALLFGQQGSMLDTDGGEWEFDNYSAKLWYRRGADRGVTIRYGKNLTDLKQEENIQTTYTGICPFWKGTEGEESQTEVLVTLPEMVVHSDKAANYPYQRTKVVDLSSDFQTKPTVAQLRIRAENYIESNDIGKPKVSLSVSFVALHQTQEYEDMTVIEHINLCDTVTVNFPELDVSVKAKVIKTVFDVLMERYDSIDIGESVSNLNTSMQATAEDVAAQAVSVARGESDESYATKAQLSSALSTIQTIAGAYGGQNGGRIIINIDGNNKTTELLVLCDSTNQNTARLVWRFNQDGLSFSGNGHDGTYTNFLNASGKANAAALVGLLKDTPQTSSWNLNTGAVALTQDTTIGGRTVDTRINSKIEAYDEALDQDEILSRLTDSGEDEGIYIGEDGLLHVLLSRVVTGGASIQYVYLPTAFSGTDVTAYAKCEIRNGVLYFIENYTPTAAEPDPGSGEGGESDGESGSGESGNESGNESGGESGEGNGEEGGE